MTVKRLGRLVVLVLALLALTVPMLNTSTAQEPKILYGAFLPGDVVLDPALATDANSITLLDLLYVGLTSLNDQTVEIQPGVATEWSNEVQADGTVVYTFKLADNIPWVRYNADSGEVEQVTDADGNVVMLTANDFVYGWKRTLDPATAGDYASVLAPWVAGGNEALAGEGSLDDVAIVAVDDFTVQITSPINAGFVPMLYGLWMARPQPQWLIEEAGDSWTNPENYQSYGPFALKEWEPENILTIIKNPFWPGNEFIPSPALDEVTFSWLDNAAQLAAYEAGEVDFLDGTIPPAELDRLRVERPNELYIGPGQCTYYYGYNVLKPPFDDARVRRAFSLAIDRDVVVEYLNGGQQPAGFFSRPNLAAAPLQEDYADFAAKSDPEAAKAELQAYLDEKGISVGDLPPIELWFNTSQTHADIAQIVQQTWKETLGVEVTLQSQDFGVYLETLDNDAPQIWRLAWCFDYPDTHNFLYDVFYSLAGNNDTNWANPEFDALLEQAMLLEDNAARAELYAQAENILVNVDAAIAPIYYYTAVELTQPYVIRTYSQTGNERFEKWDLDQ